ncbi:MAG: glycosyl transferase [Chitinispirillia bacterium]|nr:glycosyl transferase [Chitinispirillia bacterium]MCL2242194.1 glycosyl transferase [Chitinispirillia bacterium]
MKYGDFKDEAREYVITNPKTPVKWINYIGDLAFGGFVDHTGGALICKGDPSLNRITKYIQQMPSSDFKGETLYIRIKKDGAYKVFSPFFVPTLDKYDSFECRVGLGYNKIISEFYGVKTECTIFIPQDAQVELRDIRVTNVSGAPMEIDVIPVVEYTHFDAVKQFTNADWVPQTMQSRVFTNADDMKVLIQYAFMNRDTKVNYFTSNAAASSFETDRRVFLGDNEYGTWAAPLALTDNEELANNEAHRGDNIGALMHRLGTVKPQETKRIITQLGQKESLAVAKPEIEKFRIEAEVDKAFESLSAFWSKYLTAMQAETPDAAFNSMINVHNPRQCFTTYYWSRYLSYYQLGMGTRGLGFRDSSQDVMGVVAHMPEKSKELIVKLLSVQKTDGSAMHQFNPMSMEATNGDAHEIPDRPQYYGDDHLWIVLAVSAYVKETGDAAFLDQKVSFYEKDSYGAPVESGTVHDHLARALHFTKNNLGNHGLPLTGFADWNDCVNLPTGSESILNACLYSMALLEMMDLEQFRGNNDQVLRYIGDHNLMKKNLNEQAWDGEWYVSYFNSDGTPLGSSKNSHGQIYLYGQSLPIFAGLAPDNRGRQALDSARKMLNTSKGLKLSTPGFNGYDPTKGGITTYPPGAKENGGIFLHTNPWMMIAEALMGNGDRAYEYYDQINPAAKNGIIDEYECEPYVYPQNILGDEHPLFGLARNSWLSGTSSWTYQAASRFILGIRPQMGGLLIDPCIPSKWGKFTVERSFRGCRYVITVENPDKVCKGVKSVTVDGKALDKPIVPAFKDGQKHEVKVVMG